jgi:hypothetical protein
MGQHRECESAAVPIQTPESLDGYNLITIEQITVIAPPFDDKSTFTALGTDNVRDQILLGNTTGGP